MFDATSLGGTRDQPLLLALIVFSVNPQVLVYEVAIFLGVAIFYVRNVPMLAVITTTCSPLSLSPWLPSFLS